MRTRHALAALGGLGAAAATAAALGATAGTPTSRARLFQDPARTALCGIEIHPPHSPAKELLCSAGHLPRAKGPVGDPFVRLAAAGRPQLVLISQNSYVTSETTTLPAGTLWSRSLGVTCNVGSSTILCFNRQNHGFVIGRRRYRSF
jgi:hypothetical protein